MTLNAKALAKIEAAPRPSAEDILRNRVQIATSKRSGGDFRGSSKDRAARTAKLLAEFGNGTVCPCVYCGRELTAATLTQDKIYTGDQGGRYIYANLLPACITCNQARSDATIREFIEEAQDAIEAAKAQLINN
jgi:5-methylcytosine-specific restriction endonuclease McrA